MAAVADAPAPVLPAAGKAPAAPPPSTAAGVAAAAPPFSTAATSKAPASPPPSTAAERAVSPEYRASCCSSMCMVWLSPLLALGNKRALLESDLYALGGDDDVDLNVQKFEALLSERVAASRAASSAAPAPAAAAAAPDPVGSALWRTFRGTLGLSGSVQLLIVALGAAPAPLLHGLLLALADPSAPTWAPYAWSVGLFAQSLASSLLSSFYLRTILRGGFRARAMVSAAVYRKSLRLSPGAARANSGGKVVNLMQQDAASVEALAVNVHTLWSAPLQVLVLMAILGSLVGWSCLAGLAFILLVLPLQNLAMSVVQARRLAIANASDARIKVTQEVLAGVRAVKQYNWESSFEGLLGRRRAQELAAIWSYGTWNAFLSAVAVASPLVVGVVTIIVFAATAAPGQFTPANVFAALSVLNQLRFPIMMLPNVLVGVSSSRVSIRRLSAFVLEPEAHSHAVTDDDSSFGGGVAVAAVAPPAVVPANSAAPQGGVVVVEAHPSSSSSDSAFAVHIKDGLFLHDGGSEAAQDDDGEKKKTPPATATASTPQSPPPPSAAVVALADVNIAIPRGQLWAVVGPVGSGKTSLCNAILGELTRASGEVRVRGSTAFVTQTPWVVNGSVRQNVCFAGDAFAPASEARYQEALRVCHLGHDLTTFEAGDATEIGEKGVNFSGGQKQRTAIARLAYARREINILDDPLSALDAETAHALFADCLLGHLKGTTRILVTNQLQFLPLCDGIIVMGGDTAGGRTGGRIVAQGTFDDLMARDAAFAALMHAYGFHVDEKGMQKVLLEGGGGEPTAAGAPAAAAPAGATALLDAFFPPEPSAPPATPAAAGAPEEGGAAKVSMSNTSQKRPPLVLATDDDHDDAEAAGDAHHITSMTAVLSAGAMAAKPELLAVQTANLGGQSPKLRMLPSAPETTPQYRPGQGGGGIKDAGFSPTLPAARAPLLSLQRLVRAQATLFEGDADAGFGGASSSSSPSSGGDLASVAATTEGAAAAAATPARTSSRPTSTTLRELLVRAASLRSVGPVAAESAAPATVDAETRPSLPPLPPPSKEVATSIPTATEPAPSAAAVAVAVAAAVAPPSSGTLMTVETKATGAVKCSLYCGYISSGGALSWVFAALVFACLLAAQGGTLGAQYWMAYWSSVADTSDRPAGYFMGIYAALGLATGVMAFLRSIFLSCMAIRASAALHERLFSAVVRAPVVWFDTTPLGRIVARFSRDLSIVDTSLPEVLATLLDLTFIVIGAVVAIIVGAPWFALAMVPIFGLYYYFMMYYRAVAREVKRFAAVANSPVFAHFSESLAGVNSIRAYRLQESFSKVNAGHLTRAISSDYLSSFLGLWLGLRLEALGSLITLAAALLASSASASAGGSTATASLAGFSLSFALMVTVMLNFLVQTASAAEQNMNSVERIQEFVDDLRKIREPYEAPSGSGPAPPPPPAAWPSSGAIEFRDLRLRYREGTRFVLNGLSLAIRGGERVGIVGRTGAGKSSIMQALFRMVAEGASGERNVTGDILVDGVPIHSLPLNTLRRALAIIPQDPVLFSGTIRSNLDPLGERSDADLWAALKNVGLEAAVRAMAGGLEGVVEENASNLSSGQRQLACIARALLRSSKVCLLDEASSALDHDADVLIQKAVREQFRGATMLVIAHRLGTIIDADRVLVMADGRKAEFDHPHALLETPGSIFASLVDEMGAETAAELRAAARQSHSRRLDVRI